MGASAFIGRVGGLAVALGIGLMVGGVGVAEASPTDSPASTDEQATPDTARTAASVPRSGPARAEQSPAGGAPRMSRQARPVLTGDAGGDRAEARTAFPARPATSPPVSRPDTDPTGGDLAADPPTTAAALAAAPKVQPAPAGAPAESLQAPPGGDPLAPAESAAAWTLAAAARRELTPAGIPAGPAASVPPGQGVLPAASAPSVIATISLGGYPDGLAVSPNGSRAYVTDSNSGAVSVIDTATNTVIQTIKLPYARGVAVSPNGSRVYVTSYAGASAVFDPRPATAPGVSVIDTATNTVIKTIGVGAFPWRVAVSPNGSRVYVTNSSSVSVIDTATNSVIQTIGVGTDLSAVAVSPNGSRIYVTNADARNGGADSVYVIDTATNTVIKTIAVGDYPSGLAVSPNGSRAYVTNSWSDSVSVIDTATNTVIQTIRLTDVYADLEGVAVSPNGSRVYVTNSGSVSVIDTATNSVIQTISPAGGNLRLIAVSPNGARAYATDRGNKAVSVINTQVAPPPPSRANTSPKISKVTVGTPVAGTGVVTGSVAATDAEKDKLTYSAPASTAKGSTVSVNAATGAFTYTPSDSARFTAAVRNATTAQKTDSFAVTVTDGFGGTATRAVTVDVAPMGPALGALAKVWSPDKSVGQLATDTIYAEKIQSASDGKFRMVVYMSGMDALAVEAAGALVGSLTVTEKKAVATLLNSNLPALINNTGILRVDVQDYINAAYTKFNTKAAPVVEIQLVGHSNGGQQMQAYASAGTYRGQVTSLVVYGSPLIKKPDEFGDKSKTGWTTKVKALSFRNWNDPVPWASDAVRVAGTTIQAALALAKKDPTAFAKLILTGGDVVVWDKNGKAQYGFSSQQLALDFKYHGASSYRAYAAQFDAAKTYSEQRTAMQSFIGTVVDKFDKKKVDGFSPPVVLIPGL